MRAGTKKCLACFFIRQLVILAAWAVTGDLWLCVTHCGGCRVILSDAVDGCICFTRKIQHGGDWERSRRQGPKNVHNFLLIMTVRPLTLSWACRHGTEMLLILKKLFLTWLLPDIFRYDSPKKCPTILYAVNLWLKPLGLIVEGGVC